MSTPSAVKRHEHSVCCEAADPLRLSELVTGGIVVQDAQPLEVDPTVDETRGKVVEIPRFGLGQPDPAQCLLLCGEQLRGCRQSPVVQGLESAPDRSGGCERQLLADYLKHQRAPQVGRPIVEEGVGVERGVGVHQRGHPWIRRAQHRPALGPPVGAQLGRSLATSADRFSSPLSTTIGTRRSR
jgi:hypothetical protein